MSARSQRSANRELVRRAQEIDDARSHNSRVSRASSQRSQLKREMKALNLEPVEEPIQEDSHEEDAQNDDEIQAINHEVQDQDQDEQGEDE